MLLQSHYKITATCIFAFVFLPSSTTPSVHAQVELERFFPPTVQRGGATTVKGEGKFPQWPVKIECDLSELSIACGEKAGDFLVTYWRAKDRRRRSLHRALVSRAAGRRDECARP